MDSPDNHQGGSHTDLGTVTPPPFAADWHVGVEARFQPYETGQHLVYVRSDDVCAATPEMACELLFALHNADNRPSGRQAPSMSVGDVLSLRVKTVSEDAPGHGDEAARVSWWRCESVGWTEIPPPHDELIIRDRSWIQVWRDLHEGGLD